MANKTIGDYIPKNIAWRCETCKKYIPYTATCKAYPTGIPDEMALRETSCSAMENKTEWDFIPKNAAWRCGECKKRIPRTVTCKAYPKGIPESIMAGETICKEREQK